MKAALCPGETPVFLLPSSLPAPWPPLASGCGTADNLTCYCLIQHSELVQSGKSKLTNSPFPVFSSYNCAPLMLLVTFP